MADPQFEHNPVEQPAIQRLIEEVSALDNRRILVACFSMHSPEQRVWFSERVGAGYRRDFGPLFQSPAFRAALPELGTDAPPLCDPEWEPLPHITLDGYLAELMILGGAYADYDGTIRQAKELAWGCCEAMFGSDYLDSTGAWLTRLAKYDEITVWHSDKAWSPWFYNFMVGAEHTWIVVNQRHQTVWIVCTTDSD